MGKILKKICISSVIFLIFTTGCTYKNEKTTNMEGSNIPSNDDYEKEESLQMEETRQIFTEDDVNYVLALSEYMDKLSVLTKQFEKDISKIDFENEKSTETTIKSIDYIIEDIANFNLKATDKYTDEHKKFIEQLKIIQKGYEEIKYLIKNANDIKSEEFNKRETEARKNINDGTLGIAKIGEKIIKQ